jgi:hypothetical protein
MTILFDGKTASKSQAFGRGILASRPTYRDPVSQADRDWYTAELAAAECRREEFEAQQAEWGRSYYHTRTNTERLNHVDRRRAAAWDRHVDGLAEAAAEMDRLERGAY